MAHQTELFKQLEDLLSDYETLLSKLENRMPLYPTGSLRIKRQADGVYYMRKIYESGHSIELSIPANMIDGQKLIRELYEKRVCLHGHPLLARNVKTLRSTLRKLKPYDPAGIAGLPDPIQNPYDELFTLPDAFYLPGQLNTEKWIADTKAGNYRTNPYKPEQCKIPTADGHWTRSKSEEKWCDILAEESLLYRYECGLRLANDRMVYPDFTVLHPLERRLIIIEHFGLMDIPGYAVDQMQKLEAYADSGLILGSDLFFTMETKDRPLTRDRIYKVLYRSGLLCAAS